MPARARFIETGAAFATGFLVILSLHAAQGWWLNSGGRVVRTVLVLLAVSLFAAVFRRQHYGDRAVALWLGAIAASAAILFRIGPGTIWPIALGMAALVTATAVLTGTALGAIIAALRRRDF
jgi:hypothetical protein